MTGQELATAVQFGAKFLVLVVDNAQYGTIRSHQEAHYPGRISGTQLANPDFAALARAYGAYGATLDDNDDVDKLLDEALAAVERGTPGPAPRDDRPLPRPPATLRREDHHDRPGIRTRLLLRERAQCQALGGAQGLRHVRPPRHDLLRLRHARTRTPARRRARRHRRRPAARRTHHRHAVRRLHR
ncbi:thiamine pyrophosphate-dependent enzyme [Corynebacterium suedekumii]|nr:thiamine pyrophosphate-dependent enzyme [Corynebacterium suedekumii]